MVINVTISLAPGDALSRVRNPKRLATEILGAIGDPEQDTCNVHISAAATVAPDPVTPEAPPPPEANVDLPG